ncbi:vegetative cell wall protein gp1-like [Iris pallida]|uniref:Vegetative cell wall protein gp1-like n=1 Tax=Iris pallida TaxID=29817 RepID=A0AAX6I591_IRIPA|nr:vegetative cell wall protein gp1-like [Iris pallida]
MNASSPRPSHRRSTPEKRPCSLQQDSVSSAAALTTASTGRIGGTTPCPQSPRNPSTFATLADPPPRRTRVPLPVPNSLDESPDPNSSLPSLTTAAASKFPPRLMTRDRRKSPRTDLLSHNFRVPPRLSPLTASACPCGRCSLDRSRRHRPSSTVAGDASSASRAPPRLLLPLFSRYHS